MLSLNGRGRDERTNNAVVEQFGVYSRTVITPAGSSEAVFEPFCYVLLQVMTDDRAHSEAAKAGERPINVLF